MVSSQVSARRVTCCSCSSPQMTQTLLTSQQPQELRRILTSKNHQISSYLPSKLDHPQLSGIGCSLPSLILPFPFICTPVHLATWEEKCSGTSRRKITCNIIFWRKKLLTAPWVFIAHSPSATGKQLWWLECNILFFALQTQKILHEDDEQISVQNGRGHVWAGRWGTAGGHEIIPADAT